MELGQIGVWRVRQHGIGGIEELEQLGYGALWLGSSPSTEDARPYLERTSSMVVATGILNVWQHEPHAVADGHRALARDFPGRFLLGIGIGHPEATSEYKTPLATMRDFFDGLVGVPKEERITAALGPKMLDLAKARSLGAHPYFVPVSHLRFARERLGPEPMIATEVPVVIEEDVDEARRIAREHSVAYVNRTNYANNLRRLGYTEEDLAGSGSDRLVDNVIPHGSAGEVADAVRERLEAGADHVCVQPLGHGPIPADDYRALAKSLLS